MLDIELSSLAKLISVQRQALNFYFDQVDLEAVNRIIDCCYKTKGLTVLTGVGKSGIIAEKISATLVSTGTRSIFLPSSNFLHGDIGAITSEDLVVFLSKSGRTQELLKIIPHLKKKGTQVVAVVSEARSRLSEVVDDVVELPVLKELCSFDLVPTISTTIQLLFGDLLAIELMHKKKFSIEEYATNHPAGTIGRKITFTVEDFMKTENELPICKKKDILLEVLVELSNKCCGCLLIVDDQMCLEGIFTDGDLRRLLHQEGAEALEKSMELLATRDPIVLSPKTSVHAAFQIMQANRLVTVAPVIESNNRLVGLIRMHDLINEELN